MEIVLMSNALGLDKLALLFWLDELHRLFLGLKNEATMESPVLIIDEKDDHIKDRDLADLLAIEPLDA